MGGTGWEAGRLAEWLIRAIRGGMSPFLRHIRACNDAELPGGRVAFLLGAAQVGWVAPALAARLAGEGLEREAGFVRLDDAAALPGLARRLAAEGWCRHRGEAFDVRAAPGAAVLSTIDRGALPAFGIMAEGVHVNGIVRRPDGPHLWVARRAANKALDPGKLDHIVAGGMPAGHTPWETVLKEAAEEAAIPPALAGRARPVARLSYAMARPEGLRRDVLHCYDLELPEDFVPVPADGEVEGFALWPVARVMETLRDTDAFKFNVGLVLIDLFLREGLLRGAEAAELRAALGE